jgi:hypothetical protein
MDSPAGTTVIHTTFDFRSCYGIPLAQHFSVVALKAAKFCRLMSAFVQNIVHSPRWNL